MIPAVLMATRTLGTVDLPRMSRAASVVPNTIDATKRTVQVVWTTGARVMRGYFDRYWEELSLDPKSVRMGRLNNGAPLLDNHDDGEACCVLGVVESGSASVDAKRGQGVATVRFARAEDDPEADMIFRKVQDGILQNISVGYQVYRMVKVEDGTDQVPVYMAMDWEPFELSVVPMGADDGAGFRAANAHRNACVFTQETSIMDPETPTTPATPAEPVTPASPAVAATRAASAARAEQAEARAAGERAAADAAVATERLRIAEIRKLGRQHKMGDQWSQSLIEAGTKVPEARAAILEFLADEDEKFKTDGTVRIGAGDDERDKWLRGASAWMFERTGVRTMLEAAKAKMPEAFADVSFDPGRFRGMSPTDLARDSLERNRVDTRGMDRMSMIGRAFTHRTAAIGNFQTAADFPILLENVLGKVLLGAYAIQANTWQRIAKVDMVPDFRNSNRYRTGSLPGLDVIAEHGEYKSGVIPDGAKYGIVTKRLGKMFSISREAIMNDDMGALTNIATGLGQTAMRSIENLVYALITANSGLGPTQADAQPFFHANRTNVNATGSAISVLGIEADAVVLANQKDPNGQDFIDLQPAILLVPRALLGTGKEINDSAYDFDAAGTNNKFMRPNRVRGLFREVVGTPRLTGTRRYIIADPLDWIVVAFLEGYGQGPVLESMEGWRVDGVEWKVTVYANAQMGDAKAAVTNAGV